MELFLYIFYFIYVAIALNPLLIIFILNNEIQFIYKDIIFDNLHITIVIFIFSSILSWLYIFLSKKNNKNNETMECVETEIAEPKYIPIYVAYFVIALSIKNNWLIFGIVFIMIYLLIIKGKFSYFNPYLLFFGYHFYEVQIKNNSKGNAKYKLFLISKNKIKNIKNHNNLIRLNDFTYLDRGDKNDK